MAVDGLKKSECTLREMPLPMLVVCENLMQSQLPMGVDAAEFKNSAEVGGQQLLRGDVME